MPTIAAVTLGCKVNAYDTQAMVEKFQQAGYRYVDFGAEADVYLINTCTVTGTGDHKSLKLIRRVHREHPEADIIAAGCLSQIRPESVALEGVRLIIGAANRAKVVELYRQALEQDTPLDGTVSLKGIPFEPLSTTCQEGRTRAAMKIQEGCDRYCSYCIIPYARGPVRSMRLADVAVEAKRLKLAGYKEAVITGIHLMSYGKDTGDSLLDAVKIVSDEIDRVRLGSLEPKGMTPEFVGGLRGIRGLCPQFHLSLQSGCDAVLRRMNRRYTAKEYLDACVLLREAFPLCAVTTDVITGFPGETEEEFEQTCEFVKEARLSRLHVFPYSRRTGTRADSLPGQLDEAVKRDRARRLIEVGNKLEEAYVKSLEGSVSEVLFETGTGENECEGYSGSYVRVRADARPGEIETVRLVSAEGTLMHGKVIRKG
ncbi:MAG: tRNA (N(6)-L-threonylcarbamoyladenosine(37)-C(2))-methylthiotransferase MtaB [Clostridiales bacterium]|nr:tRNA (N(6)-L-threonylcarbamoyladenosine(37)-C(2))-methylthiotransferase MtaB [Clostridiales bacterium]